MAFDMSLVQRGARLRHSPFYEAEQAYGPRGYTVYNHMLFPIAFDDFEAEYWHLLQHVRCGMSRSSVSSRCRGGTDSASPSS